MAGIRISDILSTCAYKCWDLGFTYICNLYICLSYAIKKKKVITYVPWYDKEKDGSGGLSIARSVSVAASTSSNRTSNNKDDK